MMRVKVTILSCRSPCLLGAIARVLVGIANRFYQRRHVSHRADFTQATGGVAARLRIGVGERLHGLFPTEPLRLRGRADKQ